MNPRQPSQTALRIAGNLVASARDPLLRRLLVDAEEPYSRWFVEAHSPLARALLRLWTWGPSRRFLYGLTERNLPGGALYILLRKRYVDEVVRAALDAGAEQVVLFGAGLDTLSLRLHDRYPQVQFYELDHPNTQAVKRAALERHGGVPKRVHLRPVDFTRETAAARLQAAPSYRRDAPTVFVAEGVLMYLERDEINELFRTVREFGARGSTFLFTMVDADALAKEDSPLARSARIAANMGEPMRSAIRREDLDHLLRGYGFRKEALADHATLKERYLPPLGIERPVIEGELIITAVSA